jgi:prepilin-type N-terminal cleavage/methylation domain-containing protein
MNPSKNAFTLMEVLVSLFISAMIMTAIFASLESTQKAVDTIHNITLTERSGPTLVHMIREDLARLAVYDSGSYQLLKGESRVLHGADADRLDMLVQGRSTMPFMDPYLNRPLYGPINEVGYRLRERPGSSDFMQLFRREDFLVDDDPYNGGSYAMLNDRIISFNLGYYEKPAFDPKPKENWDTQENAQLPFCIALDLELEIQPRKSSESKEILGANRARLEFNDFLVISESTRWVFRNRIYPTVPGGSGAGANDSTNSASNDMINDIGSSSGVGTATGR